MSLSFNEASHRYRLDGKAVPNVTSIIRGGLPAPALIPWAARSVAEHVADNWDAVVALRGLGWEPLVKALAAIPDEIRNKAGARGTEVHHWGERVAHGDLVDVPPDLHAHVAGYVEWLDAYNPDVMWTECLVANRGVWYAGRFDLVARIGDQVWLLDLKTSRGVYGDTSLQLAAYARAEVMVEPNRPGVEIPMAQVDRVGVLHVTEAGTDLYDLGDVEPAWAEFQAALAIYKGTSRRRNLVDKPETPEAVGAAPLLWSGETL